MCPFYQKFHKYHLPSDENIRLAAKRAIAQWLQRLRNIKWLPGGPKMAHGVCKRLNTWFLSAPFYFCKISFLIQKSVTKSGMEKKKIRIAVHLHRCLLTNWMATDCNPDSFANTLSLYFHDSQGTKLLWWRVYFKGVFILCPCVLLVLNYIFYAVMSSQIYWI